MDLTTKKTSLSAQLKEVQTQLQGTRNTVGLQGKEVDRQSVEIANLNACLKGVTSALNYLSYGDYSSVVAALDGVTCVCHAAQAGL